MFDKSASPGLSILDRISLDSEIDPMHISSSASDAGFRAAIYGVVIAIGK